MHFSTIFAIFAASLAPVAVFAAPVAEPVVPVPILHHSHLPSGVKFSGYPSVLPSEGSFLGINPTGILSGGPVPTGIFSGPVPTGAFSGFEPTGTVFVPEPTGTFSGPFPSGSPLIPLA